jgi:hypothetical protein
MPVAAGEMATGMPGEERARGTLKNRYGGPYPDVPRINDVRPAYAIKSKATKAPYNRASFKLGNVRR